MTEIANGNVFNLQAWNEDADAVLVEEIQTLAIAVNGRATAPPANANRSAGSTSIMISQQRDQTFSTVPSSPGNQTSPTSFLNKVMGPRLLRTLSFLIASAIIYDLPAVINAPPEEQKRRFLILVQKAIGAAVSAGLTGGVLKALEQALVRGAGIILKPQAKTVHFAAVTVFNAFKSLWLYITSCFTSDPQAAKERREAATAVWSDSDSLIRMCATAVAAIATTTLVPIAATTLAPYITVSPILLGVLEAFIFCCLDSVTEFVMEKKNLCGGWWGMIRMWILPEEPRAWSSEIFDVIEMDITESLRCPITHNLVVDPIVGPFLPNSRPHVYERSVLYRHLKRAGRDPLTNQAVTALDYKDSRVAVRLSTEIAGRYGATVQPLI